MRLNRLYSDKNSIFRPIDFKGGLSVILAEIRVPANRLLDTHNLGKTTVGELIDFCLLKGKSASFFLFKQPERFADFTFYLEIGLDDGSNLTIARPVTPGTRVSFYRSAEPGLDAGLVASESWDHSNVAFDRARLLLDGYLKLDALRPWGFRKIVGYLVRSQADYLDVFQLGKFAGKHQDWKPFVAHLMGLSAESVNGLYAKRAELKAAEDHLRVVSSEWGDETPDPSVLDGLIAVKRRDIDSLQAVIDSFDFASSDERVTTEVVDDIDGRIAALNEERYELLQLIVRVDESVKDDKVLFRTADAVKLFEQAGVTLGDQLKHDFDQLIAFNRAITQERRQALADQLADARARLKDVELELDALNSRRAQSLSYLRESESLDKFKELSRQLTVLGSDLIALENRRSAAARLASLRREIRSSSEEYGHLETQVEQQIDVVSRDESSRFGMMRRYFTQIIFDVLGQNAILAIKMNQAGGLEFIAEFIGDSGTATSGDKGTSYKKLLCIAFDLALLRTYLDVPFPRFVYHDGALEQLEPRKRENLLVVLRDYSQLGLQPIISVLDSDMPAPEKRDDPVPNNHVVLLLHDEGEEGRLFKMPSW